MTPAVIRKRCRLCRAFKPEREFYTRIVFAPGHERFTQVDVCAACIPPNARFDFRR